MFRQKYLCAFVETAGQVFRYDDVLGALDPELAPLFPLGGLHDVHLATAASYFLWLDLGQSQDYSALVIAEQIGPPP